MLVIAAAKEQPGWLVLVYAHDIQATIIVDVGRRYTSSDALVFGASAVKLFKVVIVDVSIECIWLIGANCVQHFTSSFSRFISTDMFTIYRVKVIVPIIVIVDI